MGGGRGDKAANEWQLPGTQPGRRTTRWARGPACPPLRARHPVVSTMRPAPCAALSSCLTVNPQSRLRLRMQALPSARDHHTPTYVVGAVPHERHEVLLLRRRRVAVRHRRPRRCEKEEEQLQQKDCRQALRTSKPMERPMERHGSDGPLLPPAPTAGMPLPASPGVAAAVRVRPAAADPARHPALSGGFGTGVVARQGSARRYGRLSGLPRTSSLVGPKPQACGGGMRHPASLAGA